MCGPAAALIAITAVSAITSALGQIQQGKAQQREAEYRAAVDRNNATAANAMAQDAIKRGEVAREEKALETKQLLARQRTAFASNGLDVSSGSPVDISGDTAVAGKHDELTIKANAEREALGYRLQASNFEAQAGLTSAQGKAARSAGYSAAFGTLLSGAGSVASKWYAFKKNDPNFFS